MKNEKQNLSSIAGVASGADKAAEQQKAANEVEALQNILSTHITALESELTALRQDLEKLRSARILITSQSSTDDSSVSIEKEKPLSNQIQDKATAEPPHELVEPAPQEDDQAEENIELSQQAITETETAGFVDLTPEEVDAATFPYAADSVIFTRALSDIASNDPPTRAYAARAMGTIRHELSVRGLAAQIAREQSAQVRQICVKSLATLQMAEGLSAVERALSDSAASVRLAAVWALYRLAGTESVLALIQMFSDEDNEVRRRAVTCIGWLGQKETVADAMSNPRARQMVFALIKCLDDPEASVNLAAIDALEVITGKKIAKPGPATEQPHQYLIQQWQKWWKKQLLD